MTRKHCEQIEATHPSFDPDAHTLSELYQCARRVPMTDVCTWLGIPLTEAGMVFQDGNHESVLHYRGSQGWRDIENGVGGGPVEYLATFREMAPQDALAAVLREFHPELALWLAQSEQQETQRRTRQSYGLPEKERRPFSERIVEVRERAAAEQQCETERSVR